MNTRTQPFPIRLLSAVLYLPVAIALGLLLNTMLKTPDPFMDKHHFSLGISVYHWLCILMAGFPVFAILLLLWRGTLRLSFLLMISPLVLAIPIGTINPAVVKIAPEKRLIKFLSEAYPAGTEVYCNGVALGKVPFSISVGELLKKVAPWTTPPKQEWFDPKLNLCTWFPWDTFLRERYEEMQAFEEEFDNDKDRYFQSQYWWRLEFQGANFCFYGERRSHFGDSFEEVGDYQPFDRKENVVPSLFAHRDLLLDVLDQLNEEEKKLWVGHVLKNFSLLGRRILVQKESPELKELLDAAARSAYGLSEKPTVEECRQALRKICQEDAFRKNDRLPGFFRVYSAGIPDPFRSSVDYSFDSSATSRTIFLAPRAIEQMGEATVEPLLELMDEYWYREDWDSRGNIEPFLYAAHAHTDPVLFDSLIRYYAVTKFDNEAVFENQNEKVAGLFRSVFERRDWWDIPSLFSSGETARAARDVWFYSRFVDASHFSNPLLEPVLREMLEKYLPKCHPNFGIGLLRKIYLPSRWNREGTDRQELLRWAESLNLPGYDPSIDEKTYTALFQSDESRKYPYLKGHIASLLYPDDDRRNAITFQLIDTWLKNHPEKKLEDFFAEFVENDTAMSDKIALLQILFYQPFFEKPEEAAELLRKIWNDPEQRKDVLTALSRQFYAANNFMNFNLIQETERGKRAVVATKGRVKSNSEDSGALRIPGVYGDFSDRDNSSKTTLKFSEALYPIFEELTDEEICIPITRLLAFQNPPRAIEVLKKWAALDNPRIQKAATETLAELELREKIRSESKRLFLELATGKITPDDLIPKPTPWVWQDGKYVPGQ